MENITEPVKNNYIISFCILAIIIYGAIAKIKIPSFIINIFKMDYVRAILLSLLLIYDFSNGPYATTVILILFIISMNHIVNQECEKCGVSQESVHKEKELFDDKVANVNIDHKINNYDDNNVIYTIPINDNSVIDSDFNNNMINTDFSDNCVAGILCQSCNENNECLSGNCDLNLHKCVT